MGSGADEGGGVEDGADGAGVGLEVVEPDWAPSDIHHPPLSSIRW